MIPEPVQDESTENMDLADLLSSYMDRTGVGWGRKFGSIRQDTERVEELTESIRRVGIVVPIILGNDGRVWDGEHRLCVADTLGLTHVPTYLTPDVGVTAHDAGGVEGVRELEPVTTYVPETETVRDCFIDGAAGEFIGEDFDAWLAAHDQNLRYTIALDISATSIETSATNATEGV